MSGNTTTIWAPLRIATASSVDALFATASNHKHVAVATAFDAEDPESFYFTSELVHEGRNGNGDFFSRQEMENSWHTLVGQPIDKDHDLHVDGAVGQITDASYDLVDGLGLIRIAAFISQRFYPDVAWKLARGIVTGVSMECAFELGEQRGNTRYLHGVAFVGAGLTRMPADNKSHLGDMGVDPLSVSSRRQFVILHAAVQAALATV